MPCCDDEEHSRVSFTVMEKQMTQMQRFKVKQRRTKQQFGKCCKHCFYILAF